MREYQLFDHIPVFANYATEISMRDYQNMVDGLNELREMAMRNNVAIMVATQTNHTLPPKPVLMFNKLRALKLF